MYTANDAIDIWIVERALGQGGMGSVYRCHNRDAKRILAAIKVLDYGLKRSPKARARFVREAEILFALDHPHIVKVRNVRLDADPPYLEMEFVEGGSLERRIFDGKVDAPSALRWFRQLASALAYLHGRGIRHRDIKPSNILVNARGDATLVDFGIATEADGSTLSESGQAMGSVAYVPPEWVHAGALDPVKWDLYALGVCVYEALTGLTAFGVPSGGMSTQRFYQVLTAKQGHPPLDPGPDVPFGLRTLVRDLTHCDPEVRIATAEEALARLETVDMADVRPDFAFPGTQPPAAGSRRDAETPRGETMIPAEPPIRAANATTPPDAFVSQPFVRGRPASEPTSPPRPAQAAAAPPRSVLRWGGAAVGLAALVLAAWAAGRHAPESPLPPAAIAPPVAVPSGAPPAWVASPPAASAPSPDPVAAPDAPVAAAPKPPIVPRLAEKTPVAAAAPPPADAPPPGDAPLRTTPERAGPAITHTQLAAWLAGHADWMPDAAVAAGRADDKYLRGWAGSTPPAGKEGSPAVGVTWGLAAAFCAGRGGLAALDAEPLTWSEGAGQPWMEYRQEGGKPRWRRDDGVTSAQVSPAQSGSFIGFRCAR